jgi:hypothetical protein
MDSQQRLRRRRWTGDPGAHEDHRNEEDEEAGVDPPEAAGTAPDDGGSATIGIRGARSRGDQVSAVVEGAWSAVIVDSVHWGNVRTENDSEGR